MTSAQHPSGESADSQAFFSSFPAQSSAWCAGCCAAALTDAQRRAIGWMDQRRKAQLGHEHITELFCAHFARKEKLECETLACLLHDPAAALKIVQPLGLECFHFEHDDLRLIYAAAHIAGDRGRMAVLQLARRALEVGGYLDDQGVFPGDDRPMKFSKWNTKSFVSFACSCPSLSDLAARAEKQIDHYDRTQQARDCWRRLHQLLRDDANPLMHGVVIAPVKKKR